MSEITVTRWRKYGNDRLYVTSSEGTRLGWYDLNAQEMHVEDSAHADALQGAIREWLGGPEPELPAPRPADEAPHEEPHEEPHWEDLAATRAGAMAREQAVAAKQAAPVRTFVARALGIHTDERAWRIGADGEEKVAARLEKLAKRDPRWRFIHAVPVGEKGSDIDHVVVGPGGVFTLNAKHHPGAKLWIGENTFMVNGQRQPYLRNSRHEAERASRLLTQACGFPVAVTGIVVPVGADDLVIKSPPRDVHVVNRMALANWLRRRPEVLDTAAIDAIYQAARRSTTWQVPK